MHSQGSQLYFECTLTQCSPSFTPALPHSPSSPHHHPTPSEYLTLLVVFPFSSLFPPSLLHKSLHFPFAKIMTPSSTHSHSYFPPFPRFKPGCGHSFGPFSLLLEGLFLPALFFTSSPLTGPCCVWVTEPQIYEYKSNHQSKNSL